MPFESNNSLISRIVCDAVSSLAPLVPTERRRITCSLVGDKAGVTSIPCVPIWSSRTPDGLYKARAGQHVNDRRCLGESAIVIGKTVVA